MANSRRWVHEVLPALVLCAGCRDQAAPGLAACRGFEARGDLEKAAVACSEAALADPKSRAGREAKGLVDALQERALDQRQRDAAEALARAEQVERQADQACTSHDWVTVCDI